MTATPSPPARAPDPARVPLGALDVEEHLRDPALKQRFVTPMFDLVASRYDDFTRRFSFGMDAQWKREVLAIATGHAIRGARCADVACGTGDIALGIASARPDIVVTGVDASTEMLSLAAARLAASYLPNAAIAAGDVTRLAMPDASLDVVTAGYALRNVPSWRDGVTELARVLKPGGHLVTLDFYRPESFLWRRLFLGYLAVTGNVLGWLWHREPVAYGYIARSIEHFVSWRVFGRGLEEAGFRLQAVRPKLGGAIAIHHALRR